MATDAAAMLGAEIPRGVDKPAPRLIRVARRGPILRPSPIMAGVYGLDLTAGCFHGCPFCHIRNSSRYPGEDRVLYDPFTTERLAEALDAIDLPPTQVVLSPSGDPFPPLREVRAESSKCIKLLLDRGVGVQVMTRGRIPGTAVETLSIHRDRAKVAIAIMTLERSMARVLELRAASPSKRVSDIRRLVSAGVSVEVRLEPLIPGRNDTRENLAPLFSALAEAGARKVVAHYLFLQSSLKSSLDEAIAPRGWVERLHDDFEGGRVFRLGTLGPTKHLPIEARREGLARVMAMGAEHGLSVTTGASQNPDLPRLR